MCVVVYCVEVVLVVFVDIEEVFWSGMVYFLFDCGFYDLYVVEFVVMFCWVYEVGVVGIFKFV